MPRIEPLVVQPGLSVNVNCILEKLQSLRLSRCPCVLSQFSGFPVKMEVAGAVIRKSVDFRWSGVGESCSFSGKSRGGSRQRAAIGVRPWSDESHSLYYASSTRCSSFRDAQMKEVQKIAAFGSELSRDLAAVYSTALGMESEEVTGNDLRWKMIMEKSELLLAQLNQKKSREKEMRRKKKEEKAAMKSRKMLDCMNESSSSSSSESSESECEEVAETNKPLEDDLKEAKPEIPQNSFHQSLDTKQGEQYTETKTQVAEPNKPMEDDLKEAKPEIPQNSIHQSLDTKQGEQYTEAKTKEHTELHHTALKLFHQMTAVSSSSSGVGAAPNPLNKIEVCMGGKCKRSGAVELLNELEKKVGIEGAVVGCKCMGKCKQGPNVRVLNHSSSSQEDASVRTLKQPMCIGVGLEDVGAIAANFVVRRNALEMGLLAA